MNPLNPLFKRNHDDEEESQIEQSPPPDESKARPSRKILRDELIERIKAEASKTGPSIAAGLDDLFNRTLDYARDKAEADGTIDDDEIRHHEESRVVTAFYKELKKYTSHLEKDFHDWLWYREKTPPLWMIKDAVINEILKTTRFWDVLTALQQHSKPADNEDRSPVYFVGTKDFYEKIADQLKMSRISIEHYRRALCEVGAIKLLNKRKLGKGNLRAYQTGWIQEWEGGRRIRPLLKKDLRKQIRKFKLPAKS